MDYMQVNWWVSPLPCGAGKAAYVPVAHDYPGAPEQLGREWMLTQLKPLWRTASAKKVGQNLKYDMSVLANYESSSGV